MYSCVFSPRTGCSPSYESVLRQWSLSQCFNTTTFISLTTKKVPTKLRSAEKFPSYKKMKKETLQCLEYSTHSQKYYGKHERSLYLQWKKFLTWYSVLQMLYHITSQKNSTRRRAIACAIKLMNMRLCKCFANWIPASQKCQATFQNSCVLHSHNGHRRA